MSYQIAISGGGIGGLFGALSLAQLGHDITVFEKHADPAPTGAGIVLAHNAMANLHGVGLGGLVRQKGYPLSEMAIRTEGGKTLSAASAVTTYEGASLSSVGIHRGALSEVLIDACRRSPHVTLRMGEEIGGFSVGDHGVTVPCSGGDLQFDLLIGADGVHSRVREQLHGDAPIRYAGYRCFRGVAEGDFGLDGVMQESWGRGKRLGLVPIAERRAYWFAVENAEPGQDVPTSERKDYVLARFGAFASPGPAVLQATSPESILLHDLGDREPLEHWGRGPVTLLGDAAHPMTPNMGQGAGQAIEDGAFLAQALRSASDGDEPALALRAYEHQRIARANHFVVQSMRFGRLAQWESRALCWLRNTMVYMTPNSVGQKTFERLLEAGVPQAQSAVSHG